MIALLAEFDIVTTFGIVPRYINPTMEKGKAFGKPERTPHLTKPATDAILRISDNIEPLVFYH